MVRRIGALALVLTLFVGSVSAAGVDSDSVTSSAELFTAGAYDGDTYSLDYEYYSPVGEDDDTKYPLVIWLHGYSYGSYPGAEITSSTIALWATEEYQSAFSETEGAFVLVPRAPEDQGIYWSDDGMTDEVMDLILSFVAENADHIDTSRIYIGGHSLGGMLAWKLISAYPDFFAAAFLASPYYVPTDEELEAVADLPIWIISSLYDTVADYDTYIGDVWDRLQETTNCPEDCRLSILGTVTLPDSGWCGNNHQSWRAVLNNLLTTRGESYFNMVTVDGTGESLTVSQGDSLIEWLSACRSGGIFAETLAESYAESVPETSQEPFAGFSATPPGPPPPGRSAR